MSQKQRIAIYVLRRDLRIADNPVFHEIWRLFQQPEQPFTHLLPVYTFSAKQIEVSGFISPPGDKSPYPEARSDVGKFWRCGHLRAQFLAESLWDLKEDLGKLGSDLVLRAGMTPAVIRDILQVYHDKQDEFEVTGVWLTTDSCSEELEEERGIKKVCEEFKIEFKSSQDNKYLIEE